MSDEMELARLMGHAFGDGSIHKKKRYFVYTNSSKELHKAVKQSVMQLFGKTRYNIGTSVSGTPRYQYSNKVGKLLAEKGAPVGSKVLQPTTIPDWILNGKKKLKSSFLGALFDDEGSLRENKDCRQIALKSSKTKELRKALEQYLRQVIRMLNDLKIGTSDIKRDQIKTRSDGSQTISLRFWITGKKDISRFEKEISLSHPQKRRKLELILAG